MIRTRIVLLLALSCAALLGGCLPGYYVSSIPADGVVVDAVTNAPVTGALLSYNGEDRLTDGRGAFSFPERTSLTLYHMGGENPMWNRPYALTVEKAGYVPRFVVLGGMGSTAARNVRVRLKPSSVPEGITALDPAINGVRVHHGTDGRVLVWIDIRFPQRPQDLAAMARLTRTVAEKVVRSGLAGESPDVAFSLNGPRHVRYMAIQWTGTGEGILDGLDAGRVAWLKSAAFAQWLAGVDERISDGWVIFHEPGATEPHLSFTVTLAGDVEEYAMDEEVWNISDTVLRRLVSMMKPALPYNSYAYGGIRHPSKVYPFHARLGWTGEYLRGVDWQGMTDARWLNEAAFAHLSGDPATMFAGYGKGSLPRQVYARFIEEGTASMGRMPDVFERGRYDY